MPSLSQLLTDHRRVLVFDAASLHVQVGLLQPDLPGIWRSTTDEAGRGIFTLSAAILQEAQLRIDEIDAFIYCEGPGSMLGTRTVAMALRTWQVLTPRTTYAYQSLALAGHFEWMQNAGREFTVIADARRDSWHRQHFDVSGTRSDLQRVPAADLPAGECVMPENFRAWATPPHPTRLCSYDLAKLFSALGDTDLFRAVEAPDAFQHEAPEYKKWAAQVHSVESANKK
jgi:tRNA threonylcarbamoyladenosine biosynthesis protein TsaB